ncbi:replication initiation protein [Acinetobacter proteolyticus]|uniref:Initiator Rep protein WH1 domain-containing protein n=1 Tax=Acinetobacter proteolyticus TaxID=1776741 RepID=A0A2N0WI94_9GAMM|nr:replication initiation protein [Acinetobacter proteolyticus]PKF35491.1 hypothetical protein CW311_04165 [Acinetobacter proteolyticus]
MHSPVLLFSDIDHLVVKHNNLIDAKTQLSEVENKIVSLAIVLTRLYDKNTDQDMKIDSTIRIYASDYMKTYDVGITAAYNALNDAMDALYERSFTMPASDGTLTDYRWLQSKAKSEKEKISEGYVQFAFSDKAVELITQLENGNFTTYGIERISRLKGSYSGRIYELIIKYKNTEADKSTHLRTTKIFELETFRELLGIESHEYRKKQQPDVTRMDNFKEKVIDKSLEIINLESDITATANYHRTGRSITGISFSFEFKKDYVPSFMRDEKNSTGEMRTVGDETKQPKGKDKKKPDGAPALPTVKNDAEHLGTDLRKEDLQGQDNAFALELGDALKVVPKTFAAAMEISEAMYKQYQDAGGDLSIKELLERSVDSGKQPNAYVSLQVFELRQKAKEA